jgi:hypothetical protein
MVLSFRVLTVALPFGLPEPSSMAAEARIHDQFKQD